MAIWDAMDGTFFDSGRLLWIMMMFQLNLFKFSSLSLVYGSYEHVPIWDAMEGLFLTVVWSGLFFGYLHFVNTG